MKELEGRTSVSSPPVAHTAVKNIKVLKILWVNCCVVNIILTLSNFLIPSMTLPHMLPMWFCGYISTNIPPYIIIWCKDVEQVKVGKQKLSNMKTLVKHVMRLAVIANQNDLVVTFWSPRKLMDLYVVVSNFFDFPFLTYGKRRLYETM